MDGVVFVDSCMLKGPFLWGNRETEAAGGRVICVWGRRDCSCTYLCTRTYYGGEFGGV